MSISIKNFTSPQINYKEIYRYLKIKEDMPLIDSCIKEMGELNYSVCWSEFLIDVKPDRVVFPFAVFLSKDLAKNLKGCKKAIIFGGTIGLNIDRLILKYGVISPTKALVFQSIGSERIESLCDAFEDEIKREYKHLRPRFSAGYGDFGLNNQKAIFDYFVDFNKIGLTLNDSLVMSPTKSVTAIIGIADDDVCLEHNCDNCKIDCDYRRVK